MGHRHQSLFEASPGGHGAPARTYSEIEDDESSWRVVCITSPDSDLTTLEPGRLLIDATGLGEYKTKAGLQARLEQLSIIPPFLQRVLVLSKADSDALSQEKYKTGDKAENDGVWRNADTGCWFLNVQGQDKAVQATEEGFISFEDDSERPWDILVTSFPEDGSPWQNADARHNGEHKITEKTTADVIITHASTSHQHETLQYGDCTQCKDLQTAIDNLEEKPKLVVSPHIKAGQTQYVSMAHRHGLFHRLERREPITYVNLPKIGVARPEAVLMCDPSETQSGKPQPRVRHHR
jgi:hypothetical protein